MPLALLEAVELPRRRGDEKDAAFREKEGFRSLGILELLFVCTSGGRGAGTLGTAGIVVVASEPSRVVGLDVDDVTKEAEEKMSAAGGERCMVSTWA